MHVFFVTEWFPTEQRPYYGIFILEHARSIAKLHKVSVLYIHGVDSASSSSIQITSRIENQNLTIYQLSYRRLIIPGSTWIRQLNGAWQVFKRSTQDASRPDIIHANVNNTADVAVVLGRLANIPVVLSEHSSAYARNRLKPSQIPLIRYFMNRVDVILPVCDSLGRQMRSFGITRPIVPVQNVVDMDIFYPATDGEQVVSTYCEITIIARLSEEKAVHLAIQGIARLHQQGIRVVLNIAGDGPERQNLETLTKDLGLSEWVRFHGGLPKSQLADMLRRSSVFLLSSTFESQPAVILEALACGLPVVAPDIGGIPEVITPAVGLLFRSGNVDDLVSKLRSVLDNLSAYNSAHIRQYAVAHFSPEVVSTRFDQIYQQVNNDRHAFERQAV
ncbi:MAG: hypothetical protein C3F13_00125 [Anaerolineales bacterium]|nr:glycosyltransferase family 4 protein [Anaerolineae bacterium]PWB56869.1 MAG: hypothetical protein C3F13_00125 [Anaerolineales bacterium]